MYIFAALSMVAMIVTEIVRSIVDRRRTLRDGFGGTQDVLIAGTLVMVVFLIAGIVCGVVWVGRHTR